MRILDSRPKILFACVFHLSLALGTGLLIPETDIVAAALQAQATDLASEGRGDVSYNTSHDNVLNALAVRT